MLDELELSRFEGLVGQSFELLLEDAEPVALKLTEAGPVGELSAKQATELGKRVPFSLVFRGPADLFLPQGIRTLRHPEIGELPVFLVQLDQVISTCSSDEKSPTRILTAPPHYSIFTSTVEKSNLPASLEGL